MKVKLTACLTYHETRYVEMTDADISDLREDSRTVIEGVFSEGRGEFESSLMESIQVDEWEICEDDAMNLLAGGQFTISKQGRQVVLIADTEDESSTVFEWLKGISKGEAMNDNPKSIEYLRHLATLHDGAEDDPACICCVWAADEIERLREAVSQPSIDVALPCQRGSEDPFFVELERLAGMLDSLGVSGKNIYPEVDGKAHDPDLWAACLRAKSRQIKHALGIGHAR